MEFQRPLCLFLFLFITLISSSQATKFSVVWTPNPSENYNQWSGKNRFQVNDTIVFKYQKGSDSVLEVKKEDYDKCNRTNPIQKFEDGDTEFKFDRSGPFYFISGNNGSCENGQKLNVVVISPRTTTKSPPSPAPVATSPSLSPATSPPSLSPAATPPSLSPVSTPPSGGPSPASGSTSPSPSPSISTPPAGGPSPASSAPESTIPSPSPTGSSPTGEPLAPGAPSGSALAPGSENSPDSSNGTTPPPGSSGSFVTPSSFLVLSVTVVGAAFMRY